MCVCVCVSVSVSMSERCLAAASRTHILQSHLDEVVVELQGALHVLASRYLQKAQARVRLARPR